MFFSRKDHIFKKLCDKAHLIIVKSILGSLTPADVQEFLIQRVVDIILNKILVYNITRPFCSKISFVNI